MRVVLQRVTKASVSIEDELDPRCIGKGLLLLVGISQDDDKQDIDWIVPKILHMRIFPDEDGKMNLDVRQVSGSILVVSQFTLHASVRKGHRPSFIRSAPPSVSEPLYHDFINRLRQDTSLQVVTGTFGSYMQVELINDGPVTILIDSKNKE
jgi:D-tyrosyl-tRNA(Tyr) deacylase